MIRFPTEIVDIMIKHAVSGLPNEACGLLALHGNVVRRVYCLENVAASPDRFTIDPDGHHDAVIDADENGWEIAASFHSHPDGREQPSETDIEMSPGAEWLHVILGMGSSLPSIGVYRVGTRAVPCTFRIG